MKDVPLGGTSDDDEGKRFFFWFSEQWSALFSLTGYNWVNFTFINFAIEDERMTGRFSVDVALLGLVVRLEYVYDDTFNKKMKKTMEGVRDGTIKTVPFVPEDFE